MIQYTREQMQYARKADLYAFIEKKHMDSHIREGNSLRPKDNRSLSIKRGYCGYYDFSNDEKGNSVDYLVRHLGYTVTGAVFALAAGITAMDSQICGSRKIAIPENKAVVFPEPVAGRYRNLFAFLMNRGVPADTIQRLINAGLMYQSRDHNNIVFINYERDWAELRGTNTYVGNSFHGVVRNCRHDGFWWFRTEKGADKGYVCEAAIDAVSLYLLHKREGRTEGAYYISIGGAAKQPAIDRIKEHIETILAVDNDEAGKLCRERNPDLEAVVPEAKDWNDDLRNISK